MGDFKLVAVDLDGTLLRSDDSLSERTVNTLEAVRKAGIKVVPVTARHLAAVTVLGEIPMDHAICCLGASVHRFPTLDLEVSRTLPATTAGRLLDRLKSASPGLCVGWVLEDGRVGYERAYQGPALLGASYQGDPHDIVSPVAKLFAVGDVLGPMSPDFLVPVLGDEAVIAHFGTGFVDIVAPGTSKLGTLQQFCRTRGIDACEVVAFGDAETDMSMIGWAGYGVLMGNAPRYLHGLADEVCGTCDDDGVAEVLERLIAP